MLFLHVSVTILLLTTLVSGNLRRCRGDLPCTPIEQGGNREIENNYGLSRSQLQETST